MSSDDPISSSGGPTSAEEILGASRNLVAGLMRSKALERGDFEGAVLQLTETAGRALRVERASVWLFSEDRKALVCKDLYELGPKRHSSGTSLAAADTPAYFHALDEERTIAAHDAREDPRTREFTDGYLRPLGITSMLDAPVLVDGKLVGVVCLEHVGPMRRWRALEELVAGTFADYVAMALGAAERHRARELQASEEAFRLLFDAAPVALVLTSTQDDRVITANPRARELFAVPADVPASGLHAPGFWKNPSERAELVRRLKQDQIVEDLEAELLRTDGSSFWAVVAARFIVSGQDTLCLIGARDITRRKALEERLRELATTDDLTKTLNRRRLFEVAEEELQRAKRYERPLCVAMVDIDHFKDVNDRSGHAAGDEILRDVAAVLREGVRRHDHVGRYGGEELLVIFPETVLDDAFNIAERVRVAIEERGRVTISTGVVQWNGHEPLAEVIRRADVTMYDAKAKGRNRTSFART